MAPLKYGRASIRIFPNAAEMGEAAAGHAARLIREAIEHRGRARIMVATGNSQREFIGALTRQSGIDWKAVEAFHMDEYVGLPGTHPSSFRFWIRERVENKVHPGRMEYLNGTAQDIDGEIERYSGLLEQAPIDVGFVGFGENGHIAFNDPPVADFHDPATVKRVTLDEPCRRQQAGEGHFPNVDSVPKEALSVTCSALFRISAWVSCVPDARKAQAVLNALTGPISTACPASIVREHPNATVYLDEQSASLLKKERQ
ncbi:MAG: glucosamine-6-phosphate deaminase [Acidobacteriaceae bacterium]|nr:glucosamine-6-phosphate deaminase [Acidobacteriaceae bacterium]